MRIKISEVNSDKEWLPYGRGRKISGFIYVYLTAIVCDSITGTKSCENSGCSTPPFVVGGWAPRPLPGLHGHLRGGWGVSNHPGESVGLWWPYNESRRSSVRLSAPGETRRTCIQRSRRNRSPNQLQSRRSHSP